MCAGGMVNCITKKRKIIAKSCEESEIIALALRVRDVLWIYKYTQDFAKVLDDGIVNKLLNVGIGEENKA